MRRQKRREGKGGEERRKGGEKAAEDREEEGEEKWGRKRQMGDKVEKEGKGWGMREAGEKQQHL